ncbi:AraC family transcriptional regulator [Massilia sp. Root351]|jgi:transcriptional regulator GlxA family with amidase domain|uniref:GlxA family transcriptional regulator n=1 Tax=Massilia sp. Root351 TaxID=1736522 RepID=UPI000709540C|nr:GlxA family transcriptional regulator [Massilia sp. Root351]KQV85079.1 AraC family transcriptional regulator [Massilia sp. Root351]
MKLTLVVLDGVQALDVAGPLDVFAEANRLLPEKDHYHTTMVGGRPDSVMCSSGMEFKVHCDYSNFHTESDLLLVAGGPRYPEYQPEPAFLAWLNDRALAAGRFGAVCNGVFLLAHAGLLAGREITTHWDHAERLSMQFPDANVRPDKIFVRDGNLFTCGGVTAGIDLCLALIAEDWGHELAMKVAKRLIVYIRRDGGQSQYSPYLAVGADEDSLVSKVLRYVTDHIGDALTIEDIADAVGVSRRTFSRAFAKHAHVTPSVFVDQVRIDFARKLLEETDVPLKTVAFRCGFNNATQMRMSFSRQMGTTPKLYRERFRAADEGQVAAR